MIFLNLYSSFDYLCNEPFHIPGIGRVKCPTLREIRNVTYKVFSIYQSLISVEQEEYLKANDLLEKYNGLSPQDKAGNTLYYLYLYGETELLFGVLELFFYDTVRFNKETSSFDIFRKEDETRKAGCLNNENFEVFRSELQRILGFKKNTEEEIKFKNPLAKKMFQKIQKHQKEQKKKNDRNFELDNMIRKYCTHNKVGINLLNVWELTYYQFITMFTEYQLGRQYDYADMMAASTFVYKKASDYKPMAYMERL